MLGAARGRARAFRPESVVNISAMSFGSLSGDAVEALNRGAALAGCLQNTGEGGLSPYHRNGGDLVFQIGTAYFGCRDEHGRFEPGPAQGPGRRRAGAGAGDQAQPGRQARASAGCCPARRCPPRSPRPGASRPGQDCVSPSRHAEFSDCDSLLDWVELLAAETGLPVGIKSAVGDLGFWEELATLMRDTGRGVDFVTIDGGEGGTGAAPLIFTDSVSLPFQLGFSRVYEIFAEHGLHEQVVFIGAGKLGLPDNAVVAFALGCDMVNVGREAMLAIGCIQAQKCHTDTAPPGSRPRTRGWPAAWTRREVGPGGQLHEDAAATCSRSPRRAGRAPRPDRHRRGRDPGRPPPRRCARSTATDWACRRRRTGGDRRLMTPEVPRGGTATCLAGTPRARALPPGGGRAPRRGRHR